MKTAKCPTVGIRPQSFPTTTRQAPLALDWSSRKIRFAEEITSRLKDAVLLLDVGPDDPAGPRILSANEPFTRLIGYNRQHLLGKSFRLLQGTKTDPRVFDEIQRATRIHATLTRRLVVYDKAGREQPVEADIFPILDERRNCCAVAVVLRPIVGSPEQEEELRLNGERFSQAFEYGPIGMALIAPDGTWLTVNRILCDLIGYTTEELRKTNFQSITHPEDLSAELDLAARTLKGEINFYQIEKRYLHKQGHTVWIHITLSLVRDRDGHPLYFIKQVQDITETKCANEKIAQQAALLDKARDAIVVRDLTGKVLFWNKSAERLYGWTSGEILDRNIAEFLYTDPSRFDEVNRQTIGSGEWQGILQHRTREHGEITIEARWTLIRDDSGQPKSILAINTDVTEKKKIEAQLMRAQRMESIGTLAGGIAHDLNNILTPIMMSIEMLKQTSNHPRARIIIETIEMTAKRGADIVRQVLSFARGMKGDHVEVQPRHLLKDIQTLIKETLPKNIQLKYRFPHESWTLLGDPTQLHQILMNLCVNARDAMPGGGSLTITTENAVIDEQYAAMHLDATPGKYVVISVSDTGTGIPPAILDKIFEPFFTTKEIGKGTGLGLSTVLAIVKSHKGFLNVTSIVGQGTTFHVYVPAVEESVGDAGNVPEPSDLPLGQGETVLIVDDEAAILKITGETLEAFGYKVLTANDGAEAVALYAENRGRIAAVFTDMAMPVMDGLCTIRVLTKMNPKIKIIAASGLKNNPNAQASGPEIQYLIDKPYTAATLLKTLRIVLSEDMGHRS